MPLDKKERERVLQDIKNAKSAEDLDNAKFWLESKKFSLAIAEFNNLFGGKKTGFYKDKTSILANYYAKKAELEGNEDLKKQIEEFLKNVQNYNDAILDATKITNLQAAQRLILEIIPALRSLNSNTQPPTTPEIHRERQETSIATPVQTDVMTVAPLGQEQVVTKTNETVVPRERSQSTDSDLFTTSQEREDSPPPKVPFTRTYRERRPSFGHVTDTGSQGFGSDGLTDGSKTPENQRSSSTGSPPNPWFINSTIETGIQTEEARTLNRGDQTDATLSHTSETQTNVAPALHSSEVQTEEPSAVNDSKAVLEDNKWLLEELERFEREADHQYRTTSEEAESRLKSNVEEVEERLEIMKKYFEDLQNIKQQAALKNLVANKIVSETQTEEAPTLNRGDQTDATLSHNSEVKTKSPKTKKNVRKSKRLEKKLEKLREELKEMQKSKHIEEEANLRSDHALEEAEHRLGIMEEHSKALLNQQQEALKTLLIEKEKLLAANQILAEMQTEETNLRSNHALEEAEHRLRIMEEHSKALLNQQQEALKTILIEKEKLLAANQILAEMQTEETNLRSNHALEEAQKISEIMRQHFDNLSKIEQQKSENKVRELEDYVEGLNRYIEEISNQHSLLANRLAEVVSQLQQEGEANQILSEMQTEEAEHRLGIMEEHSKALLNQQQEALKTLLIEKEKLLASKQILSEMQTEEAEHRLGIMEEHSKALLNQQQEALKTLLIEKEKLLASKQILSEMQTEEAEHRLGIMEEHSKALLNQQQEALKTLLIEKEKLLASKQILSEMQTEEAEHRLGIMEEHSKALLNQQQEALKTLLIEKEKLLASKQILSEMQTEEAEHRLGIMEEHSKALLNQQQEALKTLLIEKEKLLAANQILSEMQTAEANLRSNYALEEAQKISEIMRQHFDNLSKIEQQKSENKVRELEDHVEGLNRALEELSIQRLVLDDSIAEVVSQLQKEGEVVEAEANLRSNYALEEAQKISEIMRQHFDNLSKIEQQKSENKVRELEDHVDGLKRYIEKISNQHSVLADRLAHEVSQLQEELELMIPQRSPTISQSEHTLPHISTVEELPTTEERVEDEEHSSRFASPTSEGYDADNDENDELESIFRRDESAPSSHATSTIVSPLTVSNIPSGYRSVQSHEREANLDSREISSNNNFMFSEKYKNLQEKYSLSVQNFDNKYKELKNQDIVPDIRFELFESLEVNEKEILKPFKDKVQEAHKEIYEEISKKENRCEAVETSEGGKTFSEDGKEVLKQKKCERGISFEALDTSSRIMMLPHKDGKGFDQFEIFKDNKNRTIVANYTCSGERKNSQLDLQWLNRAQNPNLEQTVLSKSYHQDALLSRRGITPSNTPSVRGVSNSSARGA